MSFVVRSFDGTKSKIPEEEKIAGVTRINSRTDFVIPKY